MGRKTYVTLIMVLTTALMFAYGAIALADGGSPAPKDASTGTVTQASEPSLANNVSPAPGSAAKGSSAGGNTTGTPGGGMAGGSTVGGSPADGSDNAGIIAAPGSLSGFILASNGNPSATVPSSGNTTTGAVAGMFGDPVHGLAVYTGNCAACHGTAGQPTLAFPGLADVRNPDPNDSIDPELFDVNPAWFARNIDPFLQHGSSPVGPPLPMPAFGDLQLLTQAQIADTEAYVMSLSSVNWPRLSLSGSILTGSAFVPQSTVQLYMNGVPFGAPIMIDSSGGFMQTMMNLAPGAAITANYAIFNVPGIFANGNPESGELGLDADRGAALTVARVILVPPATPTVLAAALPSTGANLVKAGLLAVFLVMAGTAILVSVAVRNRKNDSAGKRKSRQTPD
ncbi:MAG: c-type cytochrome [Thermoleophilia bacterium]